MSLGAGHAAALGVGEPFFSEDHLRRKNEDVMRNHLDTEGSLEEMCRHVPKNIIDSSQFQLLKQIVCELGCQQFAQWQQLSVRIEGFIRQFETFPLFTPRMSAQFISLLRARVLCTMLISLAM